MNHVCQTHAQVGTYALPCARACLLIPEQSHRTLNKLPAPIASEYLRRLSCRSQGWESGSQGSHCEPCVEALRGSMVEWHVVQLRLGEREATAHLDHSEVPSAEKKRGGGAEYRAVRLRECWDLGLWDQRRSQVVLRFPMYCQCVPSRCSTVNLLSFKPKISEASFGSWRVFSSSPVFPLALEYRRGV